MFILKTLCLNKNWQSQKADKLTGDRLVDDKGCEVQPELANVGRAGADLDAAHANLTTGGDEVGAVLRRSSATTQSNLKKRKI